MGTLQWHVTLSTIFPVSRSIKKYNYTGYKNTWVVASVTMNLEKNRYCATSISSLIFFLEFYWEINHQKNTETVISVITPFSFYSPQSLTNLWYRRSKNEEKGLVICYEMKGRTRFFKEKLKIKILKQSLISHLTSTLRDLYIQIPDATNWVFWAKNVVAKLMKNKLV